MHFNRLKIEGNAMIIQTDLLHSTDERTLPSSFCTMHYGTSVLSLGISLKNMHKFGFKDFM